MNVCLADPRKLGSQKYLLVQAFESGVKDVMSLYVNDSSEELIEHLKKKRYYRKLVKRESGRDSYFFFKNKKDKETFMSSFFRYFQKNELFKVCNEYGLFMGYPPKACELFSQYVYSQEVTCYKSIFVNYGGMFFASYEDSIEDDLKWLFENKSLDSSSFVLVGDNLFKTSGENWKGKILSNINKFKKEMKLVEKTS